MSILTAPSNQKIECGHVVCQSCWDDALVEVGQGESKVSAGLKLELKKCCGLTFGICLDKWDREDVLPVRRMRIMLVSDVKMQLPKQGHDLGCAGVSSEFGPMCWWSYFDVNKMVHDALENTLLSREEAKKIGLKISGGGDVQVELSSENSFAVGFPGYPEGRHHKRVVEKLDPEASASETTNILFRGKGMGSCFDKVENKYLPLPTKLATGVRIDGEPAFGSDTSRSIACSRCGRFHSEDSVAKFGKEVQELLEEALEEPRIGSFCCAMTGGACDSRITEQCTLYVKVKEKIDASAHSPSAKAAANSPRSLADSPSSPKKKRKTFRPVPMKFCVRKPARKSKDDGGLQDSLFESLSGTDALKGVCEIKDLRHYQIVYQDLGKDEQGAVLGEVADAGKTLKPNGSLIRDLAELCEKLYDRHVDEGCWHTVFETTTSLVTNALCRLFAAKKGRKRMYALFSDADVWELLKEVKGDGPVALSLAERDPFHSDTGDAYDAASKCGGLHFRAVATDTKKRQRTEAPAAFADAMAHILAPAKGKKGDHKSGVGEIREAGIQFQQLAEKMKAHGIWPAALSSIAIAAIKTKTVGRMGTETKAKLAKAAIYAWMQAINAVDWEAAEDQGRLGEERRAFWEEHFYFPPEGENWESPFRGGPPPPP